ncbi:MAG: hypothetical protein IJN96_04670 [Clostridia bacterium]|nr:hypothetical protein [Clostridia bacterium]
MKEKIYTIPINEAFEQKGFCPFCYIRKKLEKEAVEYTLGPAMMEPDFRIFTNERGFCQRHMRELNGLRNALSLALVEDTHLDVVEGLFEDVLKPEKRSVFKKEKSKKAVFAEKLKLLTNSCAVCEKVDKTFLDYIETFVFMLKTEKGFPETVLSSDGFCIEHFASIAEKACEILSSSDFEKHFVPIIEMQKKRVNGFHENIKKFEESFDYRNAGKPLEVPKDILVKTGYLLNGEFDL